MQLFWKFFQAHKQDQQCNSNNTVLPKNPDLPKKCLPRTTPKNCPTIVIKRKLAAAAFSGGKEDGDTEKEKSTDSAPLESQEFPPMTFDCPMTNHRVSLDQSDSDESIKVNPRKQGCVSVEGIDVHSETMVDVSDCQEDKNEDKKVGVLGLHWGSQMRFARPRQRR